MRLTESRCSRSMKDDEAPPRAPRRRPPPALASISRGDACVAAGDKFNLAGGPGRRIQHVQLLLARVPVGTQELPPDVVRPPVRR